MSTRSKSTGRAFHRAPDRDAKGLTRDQIAELHRVGAALQGLLTSMAEALSAMVRAVEQYNYARGRALGSEAYPALVDATNKARSLLHAHDWPVPPPVVVLPESTAALPALNPLPAVLAVRGGDATGGATLALGPSRVRFPTLAEVVTGGPPNGS